jgi:hypothetical protein
MACMGVPSAVANESQGDVAVVEANGDRSIFLLSPRRICLRLIIHRATDHGFGWFVGGMNEIIPRGSNHSHWG